MPAIALARPTAIVGSVYGAPYPVDDEAYSVVLPVNLTMYGQSSANIRVSSNGLLGLGDLNQEYLNTPLPYGGGVDYSKYPQCAQQPQPQPVQEANVTAWPNTCFGDVVAAGLWGDQYIYQGTQQGIYYQVDGSAPARQTSFEFYLSSFDDSTQFYHFLVKFYENRPNIVTFQYVNVTDLGVSNTVGVQMYSGTFSKTFSL